MKQSFMCGNTADKQSLFQFSCRGVEKGIRKCPFIHHDILRRFIQAVHRILTKVFSHLFQSTLYGILDGIDIDIFSFSDFLVFHLPVEPHQDSAALYFC